MEELKSESEAPNVSCLVDSIFENAAHSRGGNDRRGSSAHSAARISCTDRASNNDENAESSSVSEQQCDSQSHSISPSLSIGMRGRGQRGRRGGGGDVSLPIKKKDWRADREQQEEERVRERERSEREARWRIRPGDVNDADWSQIAHFKRSSEGSTGVFFVDRPSGTVVIKGTFVCLFVCLFVRLFVCLFAFLFICSFVRSFVRLFVCLDNLHD
jgi:hypothetical protein